MRQFRPECSQAPSVSRAEMTEGLPARRSTIAATKDPNNFTPTETIKSFNNKDRPSVKSLISCQTLEF